MALAVYVLVVLALAFAFRRLILRVVVPRLRSRPNFKPITPAEDRRKARPWIISMIVSAVLVLPAIVSSRYEASVAFVTAFILWLGLVLALRLVGFVGGRLLRLLAGPPM